MKYVFSPIPSCRLEQSLEATRDTLVAPPFAGWCPGKSREDRHDNQ
jgi:hypothetical protein